MHNLVVYYLLSGHVWFMCGGLFLLVTVLDMFRAFDNRKRLGRIARFILILVMPVAVVTGTPLRLEIAIPLLLFGLAYTLFGFAHDRLRRRVVLAACAGSLVLISLALEIPYYFAQAPKEPRPKRVYILGDSITAGGFGEQATWVQRVAEAASINMRDLSRPAATTQSALAGQVPLLESEGDENETWVFIEIGGNDLLGDTSIQEFAANLDQILTIARRAATRPRTVVMMELPTIPGKWSFGGYQRRLAAKHGVFLVPKRILAEVLLTDGCVVDSLHLSQQGHDRMAELLLPWFGRPPRSMAPDSTKK